MKTNTCLPKARLLTACLLLFSLFIVHQSCTKIDTGSRGLTQDPTEKFFTVPSGTSPQVKRVIENLKEQNKLTGFIKDIVKDEGYALWDKAMINTKKKSGVATLTGLAPAAADTFIHIPLVLEGTEYVNSFILAKLNGTMTLQLFRGREYENYGFGDINADTANAEKLALQIMVMTKEIFGHDKYILKDSRLFNTHHGHLPTHDVADRKFKVSFNQGESSLWFSEPVTTCTYIPEQDCPYSPCTGPGGTCDGCVLCVGGDYSCETSIKWYFVADPPDPSNGGGGGGTGGGGNTGPQQCNPTPLIENGLPPCPRGNDTGWEFEPVNDNQIIIDSLQGYPCAQAVLAVMPSVSGEVNNILHNIFGVTSNVNLKFKAVLFTGADSLSDGACNEPLNFSNTYTISINIRTLNTASKDYIAATLIHEAIHAYIYRQKALLSPADFTQLFPLYGLYTSNDPQHQLMAYNYVQVIKQAVRAITPNVPEYSAEAEGWAGLENTNAWRNRSDTNSLTLRYNCAKYTNHMYNDSLSGLVNYLTYGYTKCP